MPPLHALLASALLIAPAGRLWHSLRMVLAGCPEMRLVGEAHTDAAALTLMQQFRPTLALLDGGLDSAIPNLLARIKHRWPATRCLVLAENLQQMEEAQAMGADGILLRGFASEELYATIHALLSQRPNPPSPGDPDGDQPAAASDFTQKGLPHANLQ